jgi:type II secretory pathway component PulJ
MMAAPRARGLTLVEALVATALLAVVAVATMPVLSASVRASGTGPGGSREDAGVQSIAAAHRALLARCADLVEAAPERFGIDPDAAGPRILDQGLFAELPASTRASWSAGGDGGALTVELLNAVSLRLGDDAGGASAAAAGDDPSPMQAAGEIRWAMFRLGDATCVRRLELRRRAPRRRAARGGRAARGLTLVETLLAIAVTSMLSVALYSWSTAAVRASAGVERRAAAIATATAVLQMVETDLAVADADGPGRARASGDGSDRRVLVAEDGRLVIDTRSSLEGSRGRVRRQYALDAATGVLWLEDATADGAGVRRPMAERVARWRARIGGDREELVVELELDGVSREGRFRCLGRL